LAQQMNPFFAFPLFVMYIILFYHIFMNISYNMKLCERQLEYFRNHWDHTLVTTASNSLPNGSSSSQQQQQQSSVANTTTITTTSSVAMVNDYSLNDDHDEQHTLEDEQSHVHLVNNNQRHQSNRNSNTNSSDDDEADFSEDDVDQNNHTNNTNNRNQSVSGHDVSHSPPAQKIILFNRTKQIVSLFLLSVLVINVLFLVINVSTRTKEAILKYRWLEKTLRELSQSFCILALLFIWRLRDFDYYVRTFTTEPIDMLHFEFAAVLESDMTANRSENGEEEDEEEQNPILNLAKPPSGLATTYGSMSGVGLPVLVVHNPCNIQRRRQQSYALALESDREPPLESP